MLKIKLVILALGFISTSAFCQQEAGFLEQKIPLGKAQNVKALIHVSGGILSVTGGADDLADVKFTFDKYEWDPSVSYAEQDKVGKLTVNAKIESKNKKIDDDNRCKLLLNDKLNYSLGLVLGAGEADVDLEGFKLKKALFRLGVGSFDINLSNTSIPLLKVEAGIGEATFDLSGNWKNDLVAQINAGIGEITLIVPENVGVKVSVSGFLGSVDTPGYDKNGKVYTNDQYGKSKHNLEFKIKGAIGTIDIKER